MSTQANRFDSIGATGFAVLLGLAAVCYGGWWMSQDDDAVGERGLLPGFAATRATSVADSGGSAGSWDSSPSKFANDEAEIIALRSEVKELRRRAQADAEHLAAARQSLADHQGALAETSARLQAAELERARADQRFESAEKRREDQLSKLVSGHETETAKLQMQIGALKKQAGTDSRGLAAAHATPGTNSNMEGGGDRIVLAASSRQLLKRLDAIGDDPTKLRESYGGGAEAGDQSGTRPVASVLLEVGSDEVSAADSSKLKAIAEKAADGTRFLVVGYASTDGDAASNAELSKQRAAAVAKVISANFDPKDRVEVIYYGQTKRFSREELAPNRVVEVWQIR